MFLSLNENQSKTFVGVYTYADIVLRFLYLVFFNYKSEFKNVIIFKRFTILFGEPQLCIFHIKLVD